MLLAREWTFDSVQPGPDLFGYWSAEDIGPLDLTGLRTTPGGLSPPAFWLDETSGQALLRPNTLADAGREVHQQSFYFEVVAVSTQCLHLALWIWYEPVGKHQHTLTFAWAPLDSTRGSKKASPQ